AGHHDALEIALADRAAQPAYAVVRDALVVERLLVLCGIDARDDAQLLDQALDLAALPETERFPRQASAQLCGGRQPAKVAGEGFAVLRRRREARRRADHEHLRRERFDARRNARRVAERLREGEDEVLRRGSAPAAERRDFGRGRCITLNLD